VLGLACIAVNKTHKYMKEHEDIYVAVVEKYMLERSNAFTLIKHKYEGHTNE